MVKCRLQEAIVSYIQKKNQHDSWDTIFEQKFKDKLGTEVFFSNITYVYYSIPQTGSIETIILYKMNNGKTMQYFNKDGKTTFTVTEPSTPKP